MSDPHDDTAQSGDHEPDSRRRKPDLERRAAAAAGDDVAGRRRGLGTYSWLFLVAAVLALAFAQWTLLVAILGLALLIFVHELGHFLSAKGCHMRVERFYIGFPPAAFRRTRGETEYGVGSIPLGGFCKISGMTLEEELPDEVVPRAYYSRPIWQRNLTIFAGPLANFVAAALILFTFFMVVGTEQTALLRVEAVVADSPAAVQGIGPGDTLVGADGVVFDDWDQAAAYLQARPDETISLTYETSEGRERTVAVDLTTFPDDATRGFLGVRPAIESGGHSPLAAARLAGSETVRITGLTFVALSKLPSQLGEQDGDERAVGPAGILKITSEAVGRDVYEYIYILALISINLGILNLLPFLPFDGGHIMVNVAEKVRGRRLSSKLVGGMAAVGVTILVAFFLYVTWNDLAWIFG